MLPNPHRCRCGECRRDRKAWLRCPWAVAGPGRASRRGESYSAQQAPLVRRAPEGPEGLAAVPVGGGGAWPRCWSAAAGPGRASRRRAEPYISAPAPLVWRAPEGPEGLAAVPVGGGGAWPGFEIDHSEPQARVWRSRGRAAAHGHTKQPGPNMASNAAHGKPVGSEAITTRRAARAGIVRGSG